MQSTPCSAGHFHSMTNGGCEGGAEGWSDFGLGGGQRVALVFGYYPVCLMAWARGCRLLGPSSVRFWGSRALAMSRRLGFGLRERGSGWLCGLRGFALWLAVVALESWGLALGSLPESA